MARIIRGPGEGAPIVADFQLPRGTDFVPFKAGKLVYLNPFNQLLPTGNDPSLILGVALKDANTENDGPIPVALITANSLVFLNVSGSPPAEGTATLYSVEVLDEKDLIDQNPLATNKCFYYLRPFNDGAICIPSVRSNVFQIL